VANEAYSPAAFHLGSRAAATTALAARPVYARLPTILSRRSTRHLGHMRTHALQ
jgi:hypothetical protein